MTLNELHDGLLEFFKNGKNSRFVMLKNDEYVGTFSLTDDIVDFCDLKWHWMKASGIKVDYEIEPNGWARVWVEIREFEMFCEFDYFEVTVL